MDSTTNEIRPLTAMPSNQVAILSENSTPTIAALASATIATAQSNSPSEHIEITNIHNYNAVDCLQRLSDGDGEQRNFFASLNRAFSTLLINCCFGFCFTCSVSDGITQVMIIAITMGVVCLCAIGYQFIRQLPFILKHTPAEYRARTLILSSVYVIIGLATFVSLIAYQAFVFCDSVCHFTFVVCAYQYFALIIDYVDGESNFIIKTHGQMIFDMQTPPICCCLRFLKPLGITKQVYYFHILSLYQRNLQDISKRSMHFYRNNRWFFFFKFTPMEIAQKYNLHRSSFGECIRYFWKCDFIMKAKHSSCF